MNDRDFKATTRIIAHIETILGYMKSAKTFEEFNQNQLVVDAVVFNLTQIGEISKYRISSLTKEINNHIPWNEMYGFRNRIIHDYDQINMNIVYDTIKDDLPELLKQVIQMMYENEKQIKKQMVEFID